MNRATIVPRVRGSARGRRLLDAAPSVVLLGFGLALAALVAVLFQRVLTSNSLDLIGVEPDSIFYTERLAQTGHLYINPFAAPFVLVPYGPLFPYLVWGLHQALHLGTSLASFYLAARLATCGAVVVIMAGVGATLVRFLRVGVLLALTASLLTGLVLFPWAYVVRPDALYLALLIWAVFAFHRAWAAPSVPLLLLSMALVLCAGYAKQTGFAFVPPLCVGGLFTLRTWTQRLAFLFGTVVLGALSLAIAPYWFWQNSAVGLANGIDIGFGIEHVYWPLVLRDGIVVAAWLPCLLLAAFGRKRWQLPTALLGIYALAVGTVLGAKYGSDINYYDEYLIFAIMLIAATLPSVAPVLTGPSLVALSFGSALLGLYVLTLVQMQVRPALWRTTLRINDPDLTAIQQYFAARPSSGLVADLADDGIGAFLPTRIAFASFDVTGTAVWTGRLDLALVHKAIRSGTICYAVTRRAWATTSTEDEVKRFDWWASPWAAPVIRDLLPRFEAQAVFGNLILLHNPFCPSR